MKTAAALRKFFAEPTKGAHYVAEPPKVAEIKDFKTACTDQEWVDFGKQACESIGATYEP